jgi:hypothetical protein
MAANTPAVAYSELQDEVQRALGWRKASGSWSATQDGDFAAAVKSAQNTCYYPPVLPSDQQRGMNSPHVWSFMTSQVTTLTLRAPYSTGTVTIVLGVVTGAGVTWPSWAASGDLWVSGVRYSVNTRDSNTQLTLNDTSVAASAGTAYTLIQHYYALPADFGSLHNDGFTSPRESTLGPQRFKRVPERTVRELDQDFGTSLYPCEYALSWIAPTSGGDDARQQVQFFPVSSAERTVEYRYEIIPVELTGSGANVYHHGGPWFGELLKKATIAEAIGKVRGRDTSSYQAAYQGFLEQLETAVGYDRRTAAVETLGRPPRDDVLIEDVLHCLRSEQPWSTVSIDV